MGGRPVSHTELLNDLFNMRAKDIQLGCIAKIKKFDKAKMRADVQPLLKSTNDLGDEVDYPVLADIPVLYYYGCGFYIRPVYELDDLVWLGFSTFDIDQSLSGYARAESGKMFSLENACVISGLSKNNLNAPLAFNQESGLIIGHKDGNAVIKLDSGQVTIDLGTTGKVAIGNQTAELLDQISTALNAIATSNCVNGAPLSNSAQIAAAKLLIDNIKGSL